MVAQMVEPLGHTRVDTMVVNLVETMAVQKVGGKAEQKVASMAGC